ncbi:hypothetical protein [Streptomyces montanisoli]|uniref:Uncharacterized protein n=1 Tax=Streptomyces montanisoli TaxID=2798581 RepID=A0A940MC02_9ACTN|nr:hypothetical protein [Streptomyces montanisoli]MBP0460169.1 hypothetical protein [Streptomyces montanisoli]
MKKVRISIAMTAAAGALLIGAAAVNASAEEHAEPAKSHQTATNERPPAPPAPEWVNPDGTVDESKMPKEMPLIGSDGKVVKNADGKPLMVKTRGLIKPSGPPSPPAPGLKAGEHRSNEKDENGRMVEKVEAKPSVPPAH